jgi:hypothetical protein
MDEDGLRALLDRVSDDELPPVRVNIDLAARTGRRRLRWRHMYLPGAAPLAAAAAVALVVALVSATGAGLNRNDSPGSDATLPVVPSQFSVLEPYAAFGWLPAGFSIGGLSNQATLNPTQLQLSASDGKRTLTLLVFSAGQCQASLGLQVGGLNGSGLSCNGPSLGWSGTFGIQDRAADVNGGQAYWSQDRTALFWEYGRDAWAFLTSAPQHCPFGLTPCPANPPSWTGRAASGKSPAILPSEATQAILYHVAERVRYGTNALVRYGFTITGLPALWLAPRPVTINNVAALGGVLANVIWEAGPKMDPPPLNINVQPADLTRSNGCAAILSSTIGYPDHTYGHVMIDGVRALVSIQGTGRNVDTHVEAETVCTDVDGLRVEIGLDLSTQIWPYTPLPEGSRVGDIQTIVSHLHLLGPDPARWTTSPPGSTGPAG